MSSPHMYDPAYPAAADETLKGGGGKLPKRAPATLDLCEGSVPDLSDLNAPELSFDLQNYIGPDSGHPVVSLDDSSSLFTDILAEQHKPRFVPQPYRYPMPQQGQINSDHYGTDAQGLVIKREPVDHIDLSSCSQRAPYTNGASIYSYPPITDRQAPLGAYLPGLGRLPGKPALPKASSSSSSSSSSSKHKKNVDKSSDEYRRRRERNNIAVRKSREKAKIRTRETERKVSELVRENEYLRKKVEMLTKELNVLKTVLSNVGVPPDSVDNEVVKAMHMDSFHGMHQEL